MYRLRNLALVIWYGVVLDRFSIRGGDLYILSSRVNQATAKNGVHKINLNRGGKWNQGGSK